MKKPLIFSFLLLSLLISSGVMAQQVDGFPSPLVLDPISPDSLDQMVPFWLSDLDYTPEVNGNMTLISDLVFDETGANLLIHNSDRVFVTTVEPEVILGEYVLPDDGSFFIDYAVSTGQKLAVVTGVPAEDNEPTPLTLRLIDVVNDTVLHEAPTASFTARFMGERLFVTSCMNAAEVENCAPSIFLVMDAETGDVISRISLSDKVIYEFDVIPATEQIVAATCPLSGCEDGKFNFELFDVDAPDDAVLIGQVESYPRRLQASASGTHLLVDEGDDHYTVWDLTTQTLQFDYTLDVGTQIHTSPDVVLSPQGDLLAVAYGIQEGNSVSAENSVIAFWDVATGELARELNADNINMAYLMTTATAFRPDGNTFMTATDRYFVWTAFREDLCEITSGGVNARTGPGTNFDVRNNFSGTTYASGRATGTDGMTWYYLVRFNAWVREYVACRGGGGCCGR